jgi:hypothetical protein
LVALSVRAVAGEPAHPRLAIESTDDRLDDLEDGARRIINNRPRLIEPQRSSLATLLRLHAGANQTKQESQRHGGYLTSERHPAAAADAARAEGQHR